MKRLLFILMFLFLFVPELAAQNFLFPSSPAINQQVTGPNGQVYKWDGVKWVAAPAAAALPAANPTYTGTMTGPNLNLTGALTFSGNAVGGACPANQYMTVLSGTLIPTCAPVTSIGGVTGPFLTSFNPTFSGTLSGPNITYTGTLSGPNLTITGAVSLPNGVITDANLANAYSGIGTCPGGNFVSALNRNAAPTCTSPSIVGLPSNNPTYTGTMTGPTLNLTGTVPSLTFNGTPMGGVCTAGHYVTAISNTATPQCTALTGNGTVPTTAVAWQTLQSSGVGAPVWNSNVGIGQAPGSDPLDITSNQALAASITLLNNNTGASAQANLVLSNGTAQGNIGFTSTGFSGPPGIGANTEYLYTTGAGGIVIDSTNGGNILLQINNGNNVVLSPSALTLNGNTYLAIAYPVPNPLPAPGSIMQYFGNGIFSPAPNEEDMGAMVYRTSGSWYATGTGGPGALIQENGGQINFYLPANLTAGQPVPTWANMMFLAPTGFAFAETNNLQPLPISVSGSISTTQTPWNTNGSLNCSAAHMPINNGAGVGVANGSGILLITEPQYTGVTCAWILGGGAAVVMGDSRPDFPCVANTASPNPGSMSVYVSGGSYVLVNNLGWNTYFDVCMFQSRNAT